MMPEMNVFVHNAVIAAVVPFFDRKLCDIQSAGRNVEIAAALAQVDFKYSEAFAVSAVLDIKV